jgi:hypothetical protein
MTRDRHVLDEHDRRFDPWRFRISGVKVAAGQAVHDCNVRKSRLVEFSARDFLPQRGCGLEAQGFPTKEGNPGSRRKVSRLR